MNWFLISTFIGFCGSPTAMSTVSVLKFNTNRECENAAKIIYDIILFEDRSTCLRMRCVTTDTTVIALDDLTEKFREERSAKRNKK